MEEMGSYTSKFECCFLNFQDDKASTSSSNRGSDEESEYDSNEDEAAYQLRQEKKRKKVGKVWKNSFENYELDFWRPLHVEISIISLKSLFLSSDIFVRVGIFSVFWMLILGGPKESQNHFGSSKWHSTRSRWS